MERINKKIFPKLRKMGIGGLFLAMVCLVILPITKIFAEESYGKLSVTFESTYNSSNGIVEYKNTSGEWVLVSTEITNVNALAVRISNVSSGCGLANFSALRKDGELQDVSNIFTTEGVALTGGANYILEHVDLVNSSGPLPPTGNSFDGSAWFIWNCNGNFCKKKLTGLREAVVKEENGTMTIEYETNYFKASEIQDGVNTLNISNLKSTDYYWIDSNAISRLDGKTTWSEVTSYINGIEDYEELKALAYDPCGAENGNNSISTNGDRTFRATIYDDSKYYGITNASKPSDLTYYPSFWDSGMFNPAKDISETSFSNPAIIEAYLLEPKIILTSDSISNKIDKIELASSISPSAVSIRKTSTGIFEIKFHSNYYDRVVFKVTSGSNTYYVMIARTTIQFDRDGASVFVPTTSREDYDVLATYYFKDGTSRKVILEYSSSEEGGIGINVKHYKLSTLDARYVDLGPTSTNEPIGVSYTVVKSGSTKTNYKGTLSGSGKGTYFSIFEGNAVPDYTE